MGTALVKYEEAKSALAVCARIDEVKPWQDKAAGMAAYAKQANDPELLLYAQKIRLQAQRRAGEILLKMKENGELVKHVNPRYRVMISTGAISTLKKIGIKPNQSANWQRIAKLPEKEFDGWLRDIEDRLRGVRPKQSKPRSKGRSAGAIARDKVAQASWDKAAPKRWRNAVHSFAIDSCSMRASFVGNFGVGWTEFPVTKDLIKAADQAVREWQEFAAYLKEKYSEQT